MCAVIVPQLAAAPVPKAKEDAASLHGTWELVELDVGAGPVQQGGAIGRVWTFEGTKLTVQRYSDVKTAKTTTFTIKPDATPKQIEWVGSTTIVCKGLYQLDGDKLQICYSIKDAPTKIAAAEGFYLYTFKRAAPKK